MHYSTNKKNAYNKKNHEKKPLNHKYGKQNYKHQPKINYSTTKDLPNTQKPHDTLFRLRPF